MDLQTVKLMGKLLDKKIVHKNIEERLVSKKQFSILVLWIIFVWPNGAYSLPRYSLEEKIRCYECHYNKKGGGPLNNRGSYYNQNRTLKGYRTSISEIAKRIAKPSVTISKKGLIAKKEKEKPIKKEVEQKPSEVVEIIPEPTTRVMTTQPTLLDRTHLSADMILSFLINEDKTGPNDFYFMKAEPLVTTQVSESFLTVFGYNFAAPLLTAYGQFSSESAYIQFGSFHVPFGIDTLDYNNVTSTLVKEHYDLTLDTRDVGVEMGYEQDWFLRGAIVNGAREPRARPTLLPSFDRNLGYVINGGYQGIALQVPFLLGASVLYERRVPPGDVHRGNPPRPSMNDSKATAILNLYGQLSYETFSLLGEFAYGRHTPHAGDRSFGFYLRPSYNIYDDWGVAFRGELFARDRLFLKDSWIRFVLSSEYHFSIYASIEPQLRLNYESGNVKEVHDNEIITLVHMKF